MSDAQAQIVNAFIIVQQADVAGASPAQISLLASNLNMALMLAGNSTIDSMSLANATAAQALAITTTAREQAFHTELLSYSVALVAGFGSALFLVELQVLRGYARKAIRRMRS